jgi:DNA repair ATPase RecN
MNDKVQEIRNRIDTYILGVNAREAMLYLLTELDDAKILLQEIWDDRRKVERELDAAKAERDHYKEQAAMCERLERKAHEKLADVLKERDAAKQEKKNRGDYYDKRNV